MGAIGFEIYGHFIAYYGLMIAVGILVNIPLACIQIKKFHLDINDFVIISGLMGCFCLVGAKLLYIIISWNNIDFTRLREWTYINGLMSGGFVFMGGIIGALPAVVLCKKKLHISVKPFVQACMGCIPIGHAFGRIGCYLVGCCYGIPYTGVLSVIYTKSPFAPNGIPLFPVQLMEATIEFLLGIFLLAFSRKLKGYAALLIYLFVYSIARFFLEFLRYDDVRGRIGGISTSQILSILLIIFASYYLIKRRSIQKNL